VFGWFAKKTPPLLVFENNQAAFEYACEHQNLPILLEAVIPALVLERGTIDPDGVHHFLLRLAGRGGGRELWATTLKEAQDFPEEGDLVGFRVVKIASDLPEDVSVIGFIAVKLEPVLLEKKGWRVLESYTPKNIKPTVRW
jgi:hypothetical protein